MPRGGKRKYPEGKRKCCGCKQILDLDEHNFQKESRVKGGGFSWFCIPCKTLHEGNRYIQRRYGITHLEKAAIIESQGGVCAICKTPMSKACVDHDHATGQIRGILCDLCNNGLGRFKDNVSYLENAIQYLKSTGRQDK